LNRKIEGDCEEKHGMIGGEVNSFDRGYRREERGETEWG
jgi:hypothetical protein